MRFAAEMQRALLPPPVGCRPHLKAVAHFTAGAPQSDDVIRAAAPQTWGGVCPAPARRPTADAKRYSRVTPFCGATRPTVFAHHMAPGWSTWRPLTLTTSKASNLTQDEDPAGSQAREVELERSGA